MFKKLLNRLGTNKKDHQRVHKLVVGESGPGRATNFIILNNNSTNKDVVLEQLERGNLIITGGPGTGKTFAVQQLIQGLINKGKRVTSLSIDLVNEYEQFTTSLGGDVVDQADALQHKFNQLTTIQMAKTLEEFQSYDYDEAFVILTGLLDRKSFDYIVLDEAQRLFGNLNFESFLAFLKLAYEQQIQIILVTQTISPYLERLTNEQVKDFHEKFPVELAFHHPEFYRMFPDMKDIIMELNRGEALLINKTSKDPYHS